LEYFRGDRERPELVNLDICKSMSEIDPAATRLA